jgi:cytochrome c-type biogenesis protein CcmH/NrfG
MADCYSYVPLIGIVLALFWLVSDLAPQSQKVLVGCCSLVIIAILSVVSYRQVAVWQNSFTLFEHALTVTKDNAPALRNLGAAYQDARQPDKAIPLLEESVRLLPLDAHTWMNLGISYMTAGRAEEALAAFEKAARMKRKTALSYSIWPWPMRCSRDGRAYSR